MMILSVQTIFYFDWQSTGFLVISSLQFGGQLMKRLTVFVVAAVMLIICAGSVSAQSDISVKGVGGKLGLVNVSDDVGTTIGFGGMVDLGTFAPNVHFMANVDYWSKSYDEGVPGLDASLRDIAFSGTVSYRFTGSSQSLLPYVAGGIGLHLLSAKVEGLGFDVSESDTKIGFHFGGGLLISSSSNMDFVVDGRYSIVSDASFLALQGGVIFKMGN